MQFTERDRALFLWVNGHGFATIEQIASWMGVTYATAQRRVSMLADAGFLLHKRFEIGQSRVNWLTKAGQRKGGDALAPPKKIHPVTYFHDLNLVDLSLKLAQETSARFVPERRLRAKLPTARRSKAITHLPDGLLYINERKPIAVELEMSVKSNARLAAIIGGYITNHRLDEVWYFATNPTVKRAVERAIDGCPGFKVFDWQIA